MTRKHEPGGGWLGRLLRGLRFDRNPVRRFSDRAETVILVGALAVLLAGAPFAALAGGNYATTLARHLQHRQQATEAQVTAVTIEAAPQPLQSRAPYSGVLARWTAPGGTEVTGEVPVLAGAPVGMREPVWTTFSGQLVPPPLLDSQVNDLTTLGQVASVVGLAAVLTIGWALARKDLYRRRFAAWEADWQAIDHPHGSQHP